jgi:hypothetical protein
VIVTLCLREVVFSAMVMLRLKAGNVAFPTWKAEGEVFSVALHSKGEVILKARELKQCSIIAL